MIGTLDEVDGRGKGRGRTARRWAIALFAAAAFTLVTATAAAAAPLVTVDAKLEHLPGGVIVTGRVLWNEAATRGEHHMSVGDLRLVAISARGHRATLLGKDTYRDIVDHSSQQLRLVINHDELHAIREGNRVVLTASQHSPVGGTFTSQTYVTVGELQRFTAPQGRIGSRDCSGVPIIAGRDLNKCDLVGAFLDRASVSNSQNATRMLAADLTGATMVGANLTELSVAGGRLNDANMSSARIVKLSVAGAQATALIARQASSPFESEGANLFDARLAYADFSGAVLKGVSLNHARLDGANFEGVTWDGRDANTASFRGAHLSGSTGRFPTVQFADLSGADLRGLKDLDVTWATLCGTVMPSGNPPPVSDRDCRAGIDPGPTPAAKPYVKIDSAGLARDGNKAEIHAMIHWNAEGIGSYRMTVGDIRLVAIDGTTGLPTTVDSKAISPLSTTTSYYKTITDRGLLEALRSGNRVVLTATQHQPPSRLTDRSYATVYTFQAGPGRGRVGSRDCSDLALTAPAPTPPPPAPNGYDFCDLPGAVLTKAQLAGPMRDADLTGAELGGAVLSKIQFDGSAMGGVVATGARFDDVSMVEAFAPGFTMETRQSLIKNGVLRAKSLDGANFKGATISETSFAAAPLREATFSEAIFKHVDLGFARMRRAKLDHVVARKEPLGTSLFLADLTAATLQGNDSDWANDEMGQRPWEWATLCHTTMPDGAGPIGDRDCPR